MAWRRQSLRSIPSPPLRTLVPPAKAVREIHAQAADQDDRISPDEIRWTIGFLNYFGYLNDKNVDELKFADFSKAVSSYQRHVGLSGSGMLDQKTANAMQAPRCGVSDVEPLKLQMKLTNETAAITREPKWHKQEILYYHEAYVDGIPPSVQEDIVATAYGRWARVCGLKIGCTRDLSKADIILSTGRGPRNQFDGPGNTLAWAYLPPGDDRQLMLLYDLDENWAASVTGAPREVLLDNVTCHEGGHTLGLEHSMVPQALMSAYYSQTIFEPINPDDIDRIIALYGPPETDVQQSCPATVIAGFHVEPIRHNGVAGLFLSCR